MNRGFVFDSFYWLMMIRYSAIRLITKIYLPFLKPKTQKQIASGITIQSIARNCIMRIGEN